MFALASPVKESFKADPVMFSIETKVSVPLPEAMPEFKFAVTAKVAPV